MLSKSCEYALRAVVYIAAETQGKEKKVGIREVAQTLDIPAPFLAKILQSLAKNKILGSTKGPNGGFFLNKSTKKTTLLDVIEAVDGLEYFRRCSIGLKKCSDIKPCPIHPLIKVQREELKQYFSKKTMEQVIEDLKEHRAFI